MSIDLQKEYKDAYHNKLRNRYFGLLREFEQGREWEKFLDSIFLELYDFSEENRTPAYLALIAKTSALRYVKYEYFRRLIFDCMDLISKV